MPGMARADRGEAFDRVARQRLAQCPGSVDALVVSVAHSLPGTVPGPGRLGWFVLAAALLHGSVLWWLRWPQVPVVEEQSRRLSITLESRTPAPAAPEPAIRTANPRPARQAVPRDRAPEPTQARRTERLPETGTAPGRPPTDFLRPRQQVAPERAPSYKPYAQGPARHTIFEREGIPGQDQPPDLLPPSIWHRTGIQSEIRHQETGGGKLLIRRFDNGEMQVCTRMPDNPFDPWDDSIPLACDRPE